MTTDKMEVSVDGNRVVLEALAQDGTRIVLRWPEREARALARLLIEAADMLDAQTPGWMR